MKYNANVAGFLGIGIGLGLIIASLFLIKPEHNPYDKAACQKSCKTEVWSKDKCYNLCDEVDR